MPDEFLLSAQMNDRLTPVFPLRENNALGLSQTADYTQAIFDWSGTDLSFVQRITGARRAFISFQ
jgi:hypothetical protein